MHRSLETLTSFAAGHVFSWLKTSAFAREWRLSYRQFISDALVMRANRIILRNKASDAFAGELIRRAIVLRESPVDDAVNVTSPDAERKSATSKTWGRS
jgi:hypothetical protein